jgi:glycosyltransferase involved in cell wall biosynthesis
MHTCLMEMAPISTPDVARAQPMLPPATTVEIALATANSAPFLAELLDSLFAQTFQNFTLLVSDDGSTDETAAILDCYQRRYPGRIRILASDRPAGGPLANFSRLIEQLEGDYVLFCDHDDVWLPDKIALSLARMHVLETQHGGAMPLLLHTDLIVVGPQLEIIHRSASRYQKADPARNRLEQILMANPVTGCTIIVNRALYRRARPVPVQAVMHDHWLALVAASTGRIEHIASATVLYRQHAGNAIGAIGWSIPSIALRVRQTLFQDTKQRAILRFSVQAAALLDRCGADMAAGPRRATATLASLWSQPWWRRFARLYGTGLKLQGLIRNVALFIVVARRCRGAGPGQ